MNEERCIHLRNNNIMFYAYCDIYDLTKADFYMKKYDEISNTCSKCERYMDDTDILFVVTVLSTYIEKGVDVKTKPYIYCRNCKKKTQHHLYIRKENRGHVNFLGGALYRGSTCIECGLELQKCNNK